ncbi:MAG TPA: hypothetical protein VJZ72_04315 [Candidatus Limnocylindrales bacterium]|nr:hypothetical protein [Candidatus Limnocylindrales bacterium]
MLSAVASLAVLTAFAAAGVAVIAIVLRFTTPLERFAYGSIVGITAGTLVLVPLASIAGLTAGLVAVVAVVAVVAAVVAGRRDLAAVRRDPPHLRAVIARVDPIASVVIGALALRWAFLWRDALVVRSDGLWGGHESIWSDWPTHLALVTRFASADGFPPQNVHLSGLPLAYHYLSDLTPAAFVTLGMDPFGALALHSFVLSIVVALAVWAFARRLTGRRSAATLGMVLFLMGAGLGWMVHISTVDTDQGLIAGLLADPWDPKDQAAAHMRVFNPYVAFIMAQRAYLYGLPIAMLVLSTLPIAASRRSVRLFVAAGAIAGLLPLSHLPTLLAMAIVTPVMALLLIPPPWRFRSIPFRGWFAFGVIWVAVSAPQLLVQLGGGSGALSATRLQLGWVAGEGDFDENWLEFWFMNAGLLGILCLTAVVIGLLDRHARRGDRLLSPRAFRTMLAMQVIFLVVNVIVFQPWDWDNHKILIYWMLSAAILSSALLVAVWRRARQWGSAGRLLTRVAVGCAVIAIVTGPVLENLWMLQGGGRYRMFTTEQMALAALVGEVAPTGKVIVTGMDSHDPVQALSGRQVLMGYWGQLWVSGIPHLERQAEVIRIYRLAPDAAGLMRRYDVGAVVIGPDELSRLEADGEGFASRYPLLGSVGPYKIYGID